MKNLVINNHEAVDLGLPSGTLWATCNIGAESPEENGNYFAWGETQPKECYLAAKEGQYKWGTLGQHKGEPDNLTKYNELDKKTILEPEDDAATVNWGSPWRMPTLQEVEELGEYCTGSFIEINGVSGILLKGPNENSIFLPAAGCLHETTENKHIGDFGSYWTASLGPSAGAAGFMSFGKEDSSHKVSGAFHFRNLGYSVRAVCTVEK